MPREYEPMRVALHPDVATLLEERRRSWSTVRPGITYSMVIEVMLSQSIDIQKLRHFNFISKRLGRPRLI